MSLISRRQFLTTSSVAAGTLVVGRRLPSAEPAPSVAPVKPRTGSDMVTLGKTGIRSSLLGLSTVHAFTIGFSKIEQIDETLEDIRQATSA
jgi:hypothetical protein